VFVQQMWELYTGQRAYSGLGRDAIIDRYVLLLPGSAGFVDGALCRWLCRGLTGCSAHSHRL